MTMQDFVSDYYFHDSLINQIDTSDDCKTVTMLIDFAYWMQDNFCDSEPETGIIKVVFHNVTNFSCPEEINFEESSILDVTLNEGAISFNMLNDFSDEPFVITITADSVSVLNED